MAVLSNALRLAAAREAQWRAQESAVARRQALSAARRQALVAAASGIPLDGTGWKNFKLGDTAWQSEGWNHYDICGELRFVANWIGSSVSRCRLYVAELDELGRPGAEVTDPAVAVLAETVFGGPAKRAEAQRLLGTHLYVPGESYIVAESVEQADEDRWYVVSTTGIKRQGDKEIKVERPQEYGGGWYDLQEGRDLLIRVWTPHPRKPDLADSSVRPALPILREIEQLTKHVFAQIDSRLAGAGLLLLPEQLDFPKGDSDADGAAGLMQVLQRAMAAALADRADPSSLVPIMAQVPGEFIDKVRHLTFETPLAASGMEIRDRAIRRLGLSLDVDPEILLGKGDTNHWSAWQVEESTIKAHIAPLLARICDALTTGYLRHALTLIGKDPDQYTYWYDTSPLTVQPNRQEDALSLHGEGVLSDEALRTAGAWTEDDKPDDAEYARRLATRLVLAQPDLIKQKAIQEALGVTWDLEADEAPPALPPGAPAAPADEPAPASPPARARKRELPEQPQQGDAAQAALMMGAHMTVQRSLELAGKRLLTRANRDKFHDVPPWELHTVIHVLEADHADRLLADTFGAVPMLAERTGVPAADLREALAGYCRELLVRAIPHDIETLEQFLGWCLDASSAERDAWLGRAVTDEFHLPGLHDQRNHGRKGGRKGFEPFTPGEKSRRAADRAKGKDPDAAAPAPARQGKRSMEAWQAEAARMTAAAGGRTPPPLPDNVVVPKPAPAKVKREPRKRAIADNYPAPVQGRDMARDLTPLFEQTNSPLFPPDELSMPYDVGIQHVGRMQGYDAPAVQVSKADMDSLVAGGALEIHRGVRPPWSKKGSLTTESVLRTAIDGEYQPGNGIYGNGWYFSTNQATADSFGGPADEGGMRMRAALNPKARVIEYDEAKRLMYQERQEGREGVHPEFLHGWGTDVGRWAVAKGYDAISVNGPDSECAKKQGNKGVRGRGSFARPGICHGDGTEGQMNPANSGYEQQIVLLNRSALFVQEGFSPTAGAYGW